MAGIPRRYTFTVVGDDLFPFDMLRYDCCYPKRGEDANEIERSTRRGAGSYRVTLVGSKGPTDSRWASFGWHVESVE